MIGGYSALGGHLEVLVQPFEFLIICGSSLGVFIVANPFSTIKDCGKAFVEAVTDKVPKPRDYLDVLSVLHALMRELRSKSRSEVEGHFDNPKEIEIFKGFPKLLANADLVTFICDYCRIIIIGNARSHEVEALMDEEIETLHHEKEKPSHAFQAIADGLPALGIVAAVLGVIHAMGALDQSPEVLGGLIGAALVGTFAGIFLSYGVVAPVASKIKIGARQTTASLCARQTKPDRLHERRDAAGRRRVRPQDDPQQRASVDRHGGERDLARRRRGEGGGVNHGARRADAATGCAKANQQSATHAIEKTPQFRASMERFAERAGERLSAALRRAVHARPRETTRNANDFRRARRTRWASRRVSSAQRDARRAHGDPVRERLRRSSDRGDVRLRGRRTTPRPPNRTSRRRRWRCA